MEDTQYTLPIEHLSYSSLMCLLGNEQQFKKNYILNIWDYKDSPTAMVGKAFHRAMEMRYKGLEWDKAIEEGIKHIEGIQDSKVEWGKTGSREKVIKEYTQVINFWRAEEPTCGETIETEMKITTNFQLPSGQWSPLPLKTVVDRITRLDEGLRIWDYKVVTSFTDKTEENPDYIMQSIFNYYGVLAKYKEAPVTQTFLEIKKSKNKDGSKQVEAYEINFEKMEHYFHLFEKVYTAIVLRLSDQNHIFLPNFSHPYTGKEAWLDFVAEAVDLSMPKEVVHKTSLIQFVDKKPGFVESSVDDLSNENLKEHEKIIAKLMEFGIPLQFVESHQAANVTLYTFKPSRGIKMRTIAQYEDDLALALESSSVRIAAPLLGTKYVGVEVGSKEQKTLDWNDGLLIEDTLNIPVGQDVFGATYHLNLAKAPHLLVAGATGSGKSVFLNVAINTLMQQNSPESLSLILIDPKQTEFVNFNGMEHLMTDVITEREETIATLEWAISEMERRYSQFKVVKAKNIDEYNKKFSIPKIVIVIDELADLILTDSKEGQIEKMIVRLAQKARAAGIHLITATQRPSVNVVTGIMKANFPARVAFRVATRKDSEVILDDVGAEQLLGNGDCLLMTDKERTLIRLQSYFLN